MTTTYSTTFNISINQTSATQPCVCTTPAPQSEGSTTAGSQGSVRSTVSGTSNTPRVSRPRLSVDHATLPTLVARNSPLAAATLRCLLSSVDYDSGIVFFGFYTASGERITTHEFQTKPHRVLAPTLCIVIPDSSSNSSNLPSFGRLSHRPSRQPTHHRRSFRRHLLSRPNPTSLLLPVLRLPRASPVSRPALATHALTQLLLCAIRAAAARMRNLVGFARCHALRTSGARAHRRRVPYTTRLVFRLALSSARVLNRIRSLPSRSCVSYPEVVALIRVVTL
ncbi:hypothetical protein V8E53_007924, partial [Lactarius tabidus]